MTTLCRHPSSPCCLHGTSPDDFTASLIEGYRRHLTTEPEQDAGGHPSLALHEQVGEVWAEWKRHERSLRRLIGVRLAASVLDGQATP